MSEFNNKEDLMAFLSEDVLDVDLDFIVKDVNNEAVEVDQEEEPVVEEKVEEVLPEVEEPKKPAKASKAVEKNSKTVVTADPNEKVAIYSTKNVTWSEVGKVYRGYNIVTKQVADKWLTRGHIRLATPEEVAKEFGL